MPTTLCELCGMRQATYVCQSCRRTVCVNCFNSEKWICTDCISRTNALLGRDTMNSQIRVAKLLFSVASAMILIGVILIAAGSITGSNSAVSGGAVILIGPIPIILGIGPHSFDMIFLAVFLTMLGLGFFLLLRRKNLRH